MPNGKIKEETDGNPRTMYEDLRAHERKGMMIEDSPSPALKKDGKIAEDVQNYTGA
jgi:hypothetical protein